MLLPVLVSVFCLALCTGTSEAHSHDGAMYGVATFNMRGVEGTITFMSMENGNMMISANLTGFMMNHQWHIHLLPVDNTLPPQERCNNELIGGHFDPFGAISDPNYSQYCSPSNQTGCEVGDLGGKFGQLRPTSSFTDTTGDLVLYGRYGIIGRAIKIHGDEDVCATILSSSEVRGNQRVTLLQAAFTSPFGGTIFFRQVEGEAVVIFGKVFWTNSGNTTMGHNWHVHNNLPSPQYREGICSTIGGHFNPFNANISDPSYNTNCGVDNITNCEVGDLSNKLGRITVSSKPLDYSQYSFLFHDSFLNLTGTNSIDNRSIAIHSLEGPVQGCAPLIEVETLSVATFDNFFHASQNSRFGLTHTEPHRAYSNPDYRIFAAAVAPNQLCKAAFEAGHSVVYNPHKAPTLDGTDNTPDQYSVGNLSAKHGNIASGGYFNELPIHGIETIAGHSLGLSYSLTDSRSTMYTCRTLRPEYADMANVKMAKATFNASVVGAVYFTQRDFGNGIFGNTYITVDIWYRNPSMSRTAGHNWHIHETPPNPEQTCTESIGGHFNPFSVDITKEGNYTSECSIYSPLRCESGDLSGKHGQLNIDAQSRTRESVTYTDSNLNLFGPRVYSIIGRSVGLHLPASAGGQLFDCAEIEEVFEASEYLTVSIPYDENFDRTEFASRVTRDVSGASPSDVMIIGQSMMDVSGRTGCVNATLSILGTSVDNADEKLTNIRSQYTDDRCASSVARVIPSVLISLLPLLIFYCSLW